MLYPGFQTHMRRNVTCFRRPEMCMRRGLARAKMAFAVYTAGNLTRMLVNISTDYVGEPLRIQAAGRESQREIRNRLLILTGSCTHFGHLLVMQAMLEGQC